MKSGARTHIAYQAGTIWAILPDAPTAEAAGADLGRFGLDGRVFVGEHDAPMLDTSLAERGLRFFLTGAALSDATTFGETYAAAAREGHPVIQVSGVDSEARKRYTAAILQRHAARYVHFYSRWTVDELVPAAPGTLHPIAGPPEWRPRDAIHSEVERVRFESLVADEIHRGMDRESAEYVAVRKLHSHAGMLSSFSGLVFVLLVAFMALMAGIMGLVVWLS